MRKGDEMNLDERLQNVTIIGAAGKNGEVGLLFSLHRKCPN